jgi:hypothetical protein
MGFDHHEAAAVIRQSIELPSSLDKTLEVALIWAGPLTRGEKYKMK